MAYIIGIDGGGTKTDFMLCGRDLQPIRQLTLDGCNPNDIGLDGCKQVLKSGIEQLIREIDSVDISLFAGISGGITGNNQAHIRSFLRELLPTATVDCGSDAENAVEVGLKDSDGIAVICGTGSILFLKQGTGLYRMGGYGYLFEDGCSGYAFGNAAILAALRASDGSGGQTLMLDLVKKRLGMPVLEALDTIYQKGKRYIASFASIPFEAYYRGDAVATGIVSKNVNYIAELIKAAYQKYGGVKKVSLIGGIFTHELILLDQLKASGLEDFDIYISDELPVMGAVKIAGRLTI